MIRLSENRMRQLRFTGITLDELSFMKSKQKIFEQIADVVVDELYAQIVEQPELLKIIQDNSTIEKLKKMQRWYFQSLTSGVIDDEYFNRRLHVGHIHSRIGLTTNWYLGTYILYLEIATAHLRRVLPDEWVKVTWMISKLFNLDSQIVLEAYEWDEKAKIEKLVENRQHMLAKVSGVIQDLTSMMVQLSASSNKIAANAVQTAEVQDESHVKVGQLDRRMDEIHQLGSTMREISDQTHLIGLNAALEAARAGEAGLGFEVVANEIRKLATTSKQSLVIIQSKLKEVRAVLDEVKRGSEQTVRYSKEQAAGSQELASLADMIETVTIELNALLEAETDIVQ